MAVIMNSDDYFVDELDSAILEEAAAIEAQHSRTTEQFIMTPNSPRDPPAAAAPTVIEVTDSDPFDAFDFDVADLQAIHEIQEQDRLLNAAGPSNGNTVRRTLSKGTVQTTLFGGIAPPSQPKPRSNKPTSSKGLLERSHSSSRSLFGGRAKKTKQWDHSAYAKSGWRKPQSEKNKGKSKVSFDDEEDEPVEFEQFPAPFVPVGPRHPMKPQPDMLAARRWIFPLNQPKRDYQYNIVKHCLFENTLVALPTGLGKTFIAGVVMLNFFTWFPEGKVIFLAPSKPLVAQQIDACHRTCGIPGSMAAELTGETSRSKRLYMWEEKRVFYMTPQTLMSDLTSSNCDPRDIVLIVLDEAHKGTGDYSYAQVMRYMMAKNPHFRVLALTATPGSKPEAVQEIVDSLHISHIEIRDEESLDLRPYLHKKSFEQHVIPMDENVGKIRDLLAKMMTPLIKQVQGSGAMHGSSDPTMLHPYRCQQAIPELMHKKAGNYAISAARKLGPLSRAMGYLLESSTEMCYQVIQGLQSGPDQGAGKKPSHAGIQKDAVFQSLVKELEAQRASGFALHPKMEKLRVLLVQHFATSMMDREETGTGARSGADPSRVMVFASYRECVDEVVDMLNKENPLIRATRFVGQGTDKQGRKGFAQKEQLEVIKKFKAGEFNVLVSTSIGEEGLDIGEVDMIVCYDAQKTPIRMLQRIGRTGRKKDGTVHVLLAEGREERNWDKAHDKYKDVQHFIVRADQLELYGDVERLLPGGATPECSEMVMDIEEYIREERASRKNSCMDGDDDDEPGRKGKGKKKTRDDDPGRNIPARASTTFVNVKDLLVKGGAKKSRKRKVDSEFDVLAGESDEDDRDIEAGVFGERRTASTSSLAGSNAKKLRRSKTITVAAEDAESSKAPRKRKKVKAKPPEPTSSQFEKMGMEDSDDEDIKRGLGFGRTSQDVDERKRHPSPSLSLRNTPEPTQRDLADVSVIDLMTPHRPDSIIILLNSSPDVPLRTRKNSPFSANGDGSRSSNPPQQSSTGSSASPVPTRDEPDGDIAWLIDEDDEPSIVVIESSPSSHRASKSRGDGDEEDLFTAAPSHKLPSGVSRRLSSDQLMPPPPSPLFLSDPDSPVLLEPSFIIGAPGKKRKQRAVPRVDSSPLLMPPPSQRRLRRRSDELCSPQLQPLLETPHPPRAKKRKFKDTMEVQQRNPWIDVEATHSGDERSVGSSDSQPEDEYEHDFVRDLPETQVSPSYDQTAVYRQSLFTQALGGAKGPVFANGPQRRGWGGPVRIGPSRPRPALSSSPHPQDEDEDNEYELGSFIVEDDAEIPFLE